MTLIPAFELGVWNAWIFVLLPLLTGPVLGSLINKVTMKKFGHRKAEKQVERIYMTLVMVLYAYRSSYPQN